MKVLLLTQVLPFPPDSGPKVKTWNLVKYLAQKHEITLISFVRGDQSNDIHHLEPYCHAIHVIPMVRSIIDDGFAMARSFSTGLPWMMARDDRREMRKMVDQLSARDIFDIAHADQLNMGQYALRVKGARTILDAHNALWLLYKRLADTMKPGPRKWLLERDWRLLKDYEGKMCLDFDRVIAVSDDDRAALLDAAQTPREISVIPIAVDTDEFAPVDWNPGQHQIIHIGTMYWPPNIDGILWFIEEVYPRIRSQLNDVGFDVIGARPPQQIIDWSGTESGIKVTGYVEDPTIYLEQAGVMVVPLRAGGGMRVKILNAMAQGIPIVTTSLGCEGIAVEHGKHIMIADTAEEFALATVNVIEDKDLACRLRENAIALAKSVYDYRRAYKPLDLIYQE